MSDFDVPPASGGNPGQIARFSLTGKDPEKWAEFRDKLWAMVMGLLDSVPSPEVAQEVSHELATGLLSAAKAKLAAPGIENEKLLAEAAERFAEAKRRNAEARHINAKAEALEFETRLRKLKLALGVYRAVAVSNKDEHAILFGAEMNEVLAALEGSLVVNPADPAS